MTTSGIQPISSAQINPSSTASAEGRFSKGTVAIAATVAIITTIALAVFEVISWTALASIGASLATCYIISLAMKQPDSTPSLPPRLPNSITPLSSTPNTPRQDPSLSSTPLQPLGQGPSLSSTPLQPLGQGPSLSSTPLQPLGQGPSLSSTPLQPLGQGPSLSSTPLHPLQPLGTAHSSISTVTGQNPSPQLPDSATHVTSTSEASTSPNSPKVRSKLHGRRSHSVSSLRSTTSQKQTPEEELRTMLFQVQQSPARIKKNLQEKPRVHSDSEEASDLSTPHLQPRRLDLTSTSVSTTAASSQLPLTSTASQHSPINSTSSSPREVSEEDQEKARDDQEITKTTSTLKDAIPSPLRSSNAQPSPLVEWRREVEKLYTQHGELIGEILAFVQGGTREPTRCEELKRSLADQNRLISEKLAEKRVHLSGTNFRVFTGELTNRVRRLNELLDAV